MMTMMMMMMMIIIVIAMILITMMARYETSTVPSIGGDWIDASVLITVIIIACNHIAGNIGNAGCLISSSQRGGVRGGGSGYR